MIGSRWQLSYVGSCRLVIDLDSHFLYGSHSSGRAVDYPSTGSRSAWEDISAKSLSRIRKWHWSSSSRISCTIQASLWSNCPFCCSIFASFDRCELIELPFGSRERFSSVGASRSTSSHCSRAFRSRRLGYRRLRVIALTHSTPSSERPSRTSSQI